MTRAEALKIAKPILFNTKMVMAILDGTKTVTRRVIKADWLYDDIDSGYAFVEMSVDPSEMRVNKDGEQYPHDLNGLYAVFENNCYFPMVKAPYQVGDILYVRETWCKGNFRGEEERYYYRADDKIPHCEWHPSIHMPKEAARIFLRVTDVRAERLQDITEEQAIHEGIEPHMLLSNRAGTITEYRIPGTCDECPTARGAFFHLWNSTAKKSDLDKYGWDANPGVWVIEFERIEVAQ